METEYSGTSATVPSVESMASTGSTFPTSEELSRTHRLVLTSHWKEMKDSPYQLSGDSHLLAALTQVSHL